MITENAENPLIRRQKNFARLQSQNVEFVFHGHHPAGIAAAWQCAQAGKQVVVLCEEDFGAKLAFLPFSLIEKQVKFIPSLSYLQQLKKEIEWHQKTAQHLIQPTKVLLFCEKKAKQCDWLFSVSMRFRDAVLKMKRHQRFAFLKKKDNYSLLQHFHNKELKHAASLHTSYLLNLQQLILEMAAEMAACPNAIVLNYVKTTVKNNQNTFDIEIEDHFSGKKSSFSANHYANYTSISGKQSTAGYTQNTISAIVAKKHLPIEHPVVFQINTNATLFALPKYDMVLTGLHYFADKSITDKMLQNIFEESMERYFAESKTIKAHWHLLKAQRENLLQNQALWLYSATKQCQISLLKPLKSGDFNFGTATHRLIEAADKKYDEAKYTGISINAFKRLFYRYGNTIDDLTNWVYDNLNKTNPREHIWLIAEITQAVQNEFLLTLRDFIFRYKLDLLINRQQLSTELPTIAETMAKLLNWSSKDKELQLQEFNNYLSDYKNTNP